MLKRTFLLFIAASKRYIKEIRKIILYSKIYTKYKEFTMVPDRDYVDCLELVSKFKGVNGCVIECGVWRGGMIAGIVEVLGKEREYYLFDSFEGLPPAKEIDGQSAIAWQANTDGPGYYDNCKAEIEFATSAMKKSGAVNAKFVKGWFDDTVPGFNLQSPIAVLRLDGDWYDSTIVCLEKFFPLVQPGGLIILDDYYAWDGCSKALHDYLSKYKLSERIIQTYTSGCYLIKK